MKHIAFIILLLVLSVHSTNLNAQPRQIASEQTQNTNEFIMRYEKFKGLIDGATYTLGHDYADAKRAIQVIETMLTFFKALWKYEKGDSSALEQIGGIKAFKDKMAALLNDDDQAIRAFAAITLGVSGDKSYKTQIANLLKTRNSENDNQRYDRGRAAIALGLLEAKEYTTDLVSLLDSSNEDDRSGAALGLGYLGDKEQAKTVAKLLNNKKFCAFDVDRAIYSLILLEAATQYKDEIAKRLIDGCFYGSAKTAAYALAKIGAKEYAKDMAKLLTEGPMKGDAAKALAIMGANEYAKEIAVLLSDNNSLNRKNAALALGVMNAKQYGKDVYKLLKDEEEYVRYYAAVAIILMRADEYANAAIPIIEKFHKKGNYLNEADFDSTVKEEFLNISTRFYISLITIKRQTQK